MKSNVKLAFSNLIVRPTFRESVVIWIQSRRNGSSLIDQHVHCLARLNLRSTYETASGPVRFYSTNEPMLDITSVGP